MSDKHTLTLDHQVQQSRKVKQLTAENARLRAELAELKARTITLPEIVAAGTLRDLDDVYEAEEIHAVLRAAGITIKIVE